MFLNHSCACLIIPSTIPDCDTYSYPDVVLIKTHWVSVSSRNLPGYIHVLDVCIVTKCAFLISPDFFVSCWTRLDKLFWYTVTRKHNAETKVWQPVMRLILQMLS